MSTSSQELDSFEDIFNVIGHFGKHQILLYAVIVYTIVPAGSNVGFSIFSEAVLPYTCNNGTASTEFDERCNATSADQCFVVDPFTSENTACPNGFSFDTSAVHTSISTDFDLFCDGESKLVLLQMTFFLGYAVGPIIGGYVCDTYGRRFSSLMAAILNIVLGVVTAFSQTWWMYLILRFFVGIASFQAYEAGFVFCMEITGVSVRASTGIMLMFLWELGFTVLSVAAYFLRDWWTLQLFLVGMWVIVLFCIYPIDESARFLICRNRIDEAENVLRNIGIKNGNGNKIKGKLISSAIIKEIRSESESEGSTVADLFKNGRAMALVTLICMLCRFVVALVYYTLILNAAALPFDIYLNNIINSLSGLPGYILATYMVDTKLFGRRWTVVSLCSLAGLFCLLAGILNELAFCDLESDDRFNNPFVVLGFICAICGRSCISGCLATWNLFIAELFPTEVRANALGICYAIESVAALLTPVLLSMSHIYIWLPTTITGTLALFGGLVSLKLPETHNKPMVMNIGQAIELYGTSSC